MRNIYNNNRKALANVKPLNNGTPNTRVNNTT